MAANGADCRRGPVVVAYDPAWPAAFERERAALVRLLGATVDDVEHVGSTSVPGLAAKPIIDMIAGVESLEAAAGADVLLASRRYEHHVHRPDARLFVRVDPGTGLDTHHLHLTVPGSELWVERLTFRDALRRDPALVARYAAWKSEHATGDPRAAYDAGKTPFVAAVLAADGVGLKPDRDRLLR